MSSRFHQKYHRYNHHSVVPGSGESTAYPDAGYDPIASFDSPFRGEFYSTGDIITTQTLSSENFKSNSGYINTTLTVGAALSTGTDLFVSRNAVINGDLQVLGQSTMLQTLVYATSALDITNVGTGPALKVTQSDVGLAPQPIALFVDSEGSSVVIDNNSCVGIGTNTPLADLHIKRDPNEAKLQIEGSRSILTLKNPNQRFDISNENNGTVVFYPQLSATENEISKQLYNLKLRDETNAVTILSGGNIGIGTDIPNKKLTVNGEISSTNTITVPHIVITNPYTARIIPQIVTVLPSDANDVELVSTSTALITAFVGGTKGLLYTLTNAGTQAITLSATNINGLSRIYIRNGTAWRSHRFILNIAYLQLQPYTSCNLRMGDNQIVSVW